MDTQTVENRVLEIISMEYPYGEKMNLLHALGLEFIKDKLSLRIEKYKEAREVIKTACTLITFEEREVEKGLVKVEGNIYRDRDGHYHFWSGERWINHVSEKLILDTRPSPFYRVNISGVPDYFYIIVKGHSCWFTDAYGKDQFTFMDVRGNEARTMNINGGSAEMEYNPSNGGVTIRKSEYAFF